MRKILIFTFLVISTSLYCDEDVQLLRREDYFGVVDRLIKGAKRPIDIYMYFIIADSEDSGNPVNQLLDSIIQARGLSAQLNEPNDIKKIETFIGLIQEYGYRRVAEVNRITARYKKGTGLYSIETTIRLLDVGEK